MFDAIFRELVKKMVDLGLKPEDDSKEKDKKKTRKSVNDMG